MFLANPREHQKTLQTVVEVRVICCLNLKAHFSSVWESSREVAQLPLLSKAAQFSLKQIAISRDFWHKVRENGNSCPIELAIVLSRYCIDSSSKLWASYKIQDSVHDFFFRVLWKSRREWRAYFLSFLLWMYRRWAQRQCWTPFMSNVDGPGSSVFLFIDFYA